ncbi:MAG: methylamine utilization protein [Sphingomonadaceae bacterium]|nr:methylamine utilization protein [Sphingomonadaceae bacterium]
MRTIALILMLLRPVAAHAGDVTLALRTANGRPLADAVVTVHPANGVPRTPIRFPWSYDVVQQNLQFVPHVQIVPVGATVRFPNRDRVRHHVYSFSRPARFELRLYGRDEARSYTFTTEGAVAIGCNIHDQMTGYIKVVDTPWAARSDAQGRVRIASVPGGAARVTIWHPRLRGRESESVYNVTIPATGTFARQVTLETR